MSRQPELVKLARRAMMNDPESISGDLVRSWDALLAKNQRLEQALDHRNADACGLLAENQRLRDALLSIASYGDQLSINEAEVERMGRYAREALAGDGDA